MARPGAPQLLISLFFLSFPRYRCNYHIFMLNLTHILFALIVSQPSTNYPIARFVFALLRYMFKKEV